MPPTPRQYDLARLIATEGLSIKEAAVRMGISRYTVRSQLYGTTARDGLYVRIGAHSMVDVARWWYTQRQEGASC